MPLILVLLAIETADIMFALDLVPAVLAITRKFFTLYAFIHEWRIHHNKRKQLKIRGILRRR